MNLEDIRANIKTMLSIGVELTDIDIDRATTQAVAVLSRFFPRELVKVFVYNEDVTSEAFTNTHGTAVSLANKPIRFGSETVKQGATEFTRDTDFEMDYINGTITSLSAGAMANSTASTITYKVDQIRLDISSVTDMMAIQRIETRKADDVPILWDSFDLWGDFLILLTEGVNSQTRISDNTHIILYYMAHHADPTLAAKGSYPLFLDELVLMGVSGYSLLIEMMQQEHKAVIEADSARTALAASDDENTAIATALTNSGTALTNLGTALAAMRGVAGEPLDDAKTALDKVATHVAEAGTALAKVATHVTEAGTALAKVATHTGTEADAALDKVATHIVDADTTLDAITVVAAELTDVKTALNKVTTHVGTEADAAIDAVAALITLATTALDKIAAELQTATRNADAYLNSGDAFIEPVNTGMAVPENYAVYAQAKIGMAQSYVSDAAGRLRQVDARLGEGGQRIAMAQAFIGEAAQRIGSLNVRLGEAAQRISMALGYVREAETRNTMSQAFINEAIQRLGMSQAFATEAVQRLGMAAAFFNEAGARIAHAAQLVGEAQTYRQQADGYFTEIVQRLAIEQTAIAQATGYQANAVAFRESANLFRIEANARIAEFISALQDRSQIATHTRTASVRQYAQ